MAWAWWLLAPACTTICGALVLWWRMIVQQRATTWHQAGAMRQHRALLAALSEHTTAGSEPVNMVLLPASVDEVGPTNS